MLAHLCAGPEYESLVLAAGLEYVSMRPSLPQAFKASAGRRVASANAFNFRTRTATFLAPLLEAWCVQAMLTLSWSQAGTYQRGLLRSPLHDTETCRRIRDRAA